MILTHNNILASIRAAATAFKIGPRDICLSFLPLSHIFERVDGYYLMLHQRAVIAFAENIDSVPLNLAEARPTVVFVSGGAPLMRSVAEFFFSADIPIYEGYGLTETASGIAFNTADQLRLETVGKILPGTRIRIAEDGEILLQGPTIFQGYWNSPELTAETLQDGWLKTGDIGQLDRNGFLSITDRKKDLIVTAGGKNVGPQYLENRLKSDPLLSNALIYGDGKPYLIALLVPDFEVLELFARNNKIDFLNHCGMVSHPRILELVRGHVDKLQENLPSYTRIKRFALISRDFSSEGNEVTPTLKLKRQVIAHNFHRILEGMYLAEDHGIHDSGFCIVGDPTEEPPAKSS